MLKIACVKKSPWNYTKTPAILSMYNARHGELHGKHPGKSSLANTSCMKKINITCHNLQNRTENLIKKLWKI